MSKIIDLSAVTDAARIAIKQGTLKFIQDSYGENFTAILVMLIGSTYNPATMYVLYGCVNTGVGLNYVISAGAVFYQGEIFLVDAAAFTTTGTNVPVMSLIVTQYTTNADPMTFTDSTVRNIHNIRKVQISSGASGSGFSNFSAVSYLSFFIPAPVNLSGGGVTGAYPNYVIPGLSNSHPVLAAGNMNLGDIAAGGGSDFNVVFTADIGTAAYYIVGTLISQGTPNQDTTCSWTARGKTTSQFTIRVQEWSSQTQNLSFDYVVFAHS